MPVRRISGAVVGVLLGALMAALTCLPLWLFCYFVMLLTLARLSLAEWMVENLLIGSVWPYVIVTVAWTAGLGLAGFLYGPTIFTRRELTWLNPRRRGLEPLDRDMLAG
ncbi:MAG: hypothetical protein AAGA92_05050 [Planctomycetota bacterium]